MLPSLTVLTVVFMSLFSPFASFANGGHLNEHESANGIVLSNAIVTGAYCGLDNGTINIIVDSGPCVDYQYSIDGGLTFSTSPMFTGLPIGDYLIAVNCVEDPSCATVTTIQIASAPDLEIEEIIFDCQPGANSAAYEMVVSGGTAEYTLTYNDPNGGIYETQSFSDTIVFEINDIVEGNYTIFLEDRLGCVKDTTFLVEECCVFEYLCNDAPILLDCISDLPPIDIEYLDATTLGLSDLDSLQADNILQITANCYEAIVTAEDIYTNSPTECITDTLKIDRVYTIDQFGILYTCVQPYQILYFQAPVLGQAEDQVIECTTDSQATFDAWIANAGNAAFSMCNPDVIWTTDPANPTLPSDCGANGSLAVTFSFTDGCGNTGSTQATFTVEDTTPPNLVCPDDLTLTCGDDLAAIDVWLASVGSDDDCGTPNVEHNFDENNFVISCGASGEYVVTFTATDECGLTTDCMATVYVEDPSSYQILCPSNLEVNPEDTDLLMQVQEWLALATTDDPCIAVDIPVANNFDPADLVVDCGYLGIMVTFTSVNDCGIERVCTAEIIGNQENGPQITCPNELVLQCGDANNDAIVMAWLSTAAAFDIDGNPIVLNHNFVQLNDNCGLQEILFSGTDNCDQDVSCTASIMIEDLEKPTISCPAELNLACGFDQAAVDAWLDSITGDDACGVASIENDFDIDNFTVTCGDSKQYEVTFTIKDFCDNEEVCTSYINVIDVSNLTINCPANVIIDLEAANYQDDIDAWLISATTDDACSLGLTIVHDFDPSTFVAQCGFVSVEVTFDVETMCGVVASCTATITGTEENGPSITCPEAITISCGDTNTAQIVDAWTATVVAEDVDGNPLSVNSNFQTGMLESCGSVEIIFSVLDDCDNELTCSQFITIEDAEGPQIVCDIDRKVDISAGDIQGQIQAITDNISVLDNCSNDIVVTHILNGETAGVGCGDYLDLEITATDECGNASVCLTQIEFIDFNEIYIECPDAFTISCQEENLLERIDEYLETVLVSSTRLDAVLSYDFDPESINTDCNDYISFDVEFIAADDCGNEEICNVAIEILPEMKIFIPNIFTPNDDGLNDMVTVYANKNVVLVKEFVIYDRWGEVVFRSLDTRPNVEGLGWNGMFKGRLGDINVYTYMITIQDDFGREETHSGTTTLMK